MIKKKGYLTAALLLFCTVNLQTKERFMLNRDVMDFMPRKSHRHIRYTPAEIFRTDRIRMIQFDAISILLDGTLGWAKTIADGYGTRSTVIGKIYIRGLYLPQGNTWTGRVYPTNRIVIIRNRTYPLFQLHPVKRKKK